MNKVKKEIPIEQQKMKKASKDSQLARNQLHFDESESHRVEGYARSSDRRNQGRRDFKMEDKKDTQ